MSPEHYPANTSKSDDARHAAIDEHLVAYLRAYEEYIACHVEMQAQLREGLLGLTRARRDLMRNGCVVGPSFFPAEIEPLVVVGIRPAKVPDIPTELSYIFSEEGATVNRSHEADSTSVETSDAMAAKGTEVSDAHMIAELQKMGLDSEMQHDIASAVRDDGEDLFGVACHNTIVINSADGGRRVVKTSSEMTFAASGLADLKHAQFCAAMNTSAMESAGQSRPNAKPAAAGDPMSWYSLLPPPSLRQTQKGFRRAAEMAVALANAQARMHEAWQRHEAMTERQRHSHEG